jgi:AAA15 family ATPase/GTPase
MFINLRYGMKDVAINLAGAKEAMTNQTRAIKEYSATAKELTDADIMARDRVNISMAEYKSMLKLIEDYNKLLYERDFIAAILAKFAYVSKCPINELKVDMDSIMCYQDVDIHNGKTTYGIKFTADEWR